MRAVTLEFKKAGSSSIINISSIAGLVGGQGGVAYSKSFVDKEFNSSSVVIPFPSL
jgi:short-subunit dehydrogenase